jgi:hypothetical protein
MVRKCSRRAFLIQRSGGRLSFFFAYRGVEIPGPDGMVGGLAGGTYDD